MAPSPIGQPYSRGVSSLSAPFSPLDNRSFRLLTGRSNLAPSGYLELQDLSIPSSDDDSLNPDTALSQAAQLLLDGTTALSHPFIDLVTLKPLLKSAGFTSISEERYFWPSNTWPRDPRLKEVGALNCVNMKDGIEGMLMGVGTRGLGWTVEDIKLLASVARDDMENRRIHAYWPV
jgi:hypothetical protein